jgi:hypothetical protein
MKMIYSRKKHETIKHGSNFLQGSKVTDKLISYVIKNIMEELLLIKCNNLLIKKFYN